MSLFRRTFSRRLPDHLLEISERIYVFDCCFSSSVLSEKEYKAYLGGVVASLHRFHPGASCMVFNFKEGDQMSLLSDILIDYDMTVVDYPRHYEGYPLLPLEMIHYFVRSSESWLSLEGQKNVILTHCEGGGWPVLAFMLAGLLLYRKQYSGEQKTLEMVYKQAPKELFSVLSPINPRASQLRYLQYITGRDLASDWPPSDAPLIVDYLILRNLPLFDSGKGCRPVIRVYGQDPSARANRSPKLLFSSLIAEEHAWQYPKEECVFVKIELRCQVQGDVFLECIHLYDNLVSEEMIFKIMFHTGFIQSNVLALNSDEVDVPWNTEYKVPKDFKTEILFRDMNEVPLNITMELGSGDEGHDSESEFFEVEEIFTPIPESQDRKADFKTITVKDVNVLDNNNKDCTLHNGAPRWDLESGVTDLCYSKEIAVNEGNHKAVAEIESHIKDIIVIDDSCSKEIALDEGNQTQPSETEPDIKAHKNVMATDLSSLDQKAVIEVLPIEDSEEESSICAPKNIVVVDDGNRKQPLETGSSISASNNTAQKNVMAADLSFLEQKVLNEVLHKQDSEEPSIIALKNIIVVDDGNHKQPSETGSSISASDNTPQKNVMAADLSSLEQKALSEVLHKQDSEEESSVSALKNILVVDDRNPKQPSVAGSSINESKNSVVIDDRNHKQPSEIGSDIHSSKNIVVVDNGSQIQDIKVEIEPKPLPSPTQPKQNKKAKWKEITAKTIKQQRVISQWVPRTKPAAPEPSKPKAPAYKWVPKGAPPPADGQ